MELKGYIQKFKLYLFDMDGTLYLGDRLYDFTIELLDTIKKTGGTWGLIEMLSWFHCIITFPFYRYN